LGPKSYYGKWIAKERQREIQKWGGRCQVCGNSTYEELQFAHVKPTSLDGGGRGSYARLKDVQKHPECYRLLCETCHQGFDHETNPDIQKIYKEILKLVDIPAV